MLLNLEYVHSTRKKRQIKTYEMKYPFQFTHVWKSFNTTSKKAGHKYLNTT